MDERLTTGEDYCSRFCENDENSCPVRKSCINRKMYEKLKQLEDNMEKGMVKTFPCRIGDKLYVLKKVKRNGIIRDEILDFEVTGFGTEDGGWVAYAEHKEPKSITEMEKYIRFPGLVLLSEIGVSVFLKREDLEKKLRESGKMTKAIDVFPPRSHEYMRLFAAAKLIEAETGKICIVETIYFDYGQDWKWTTITMEDAGQILNPKEQEEIVYGNYGTMTDCVREIIERHQKKGM